MRKPKQQAPEGEIPKWAVTKIKKLSKDSGIASSKLLELALRFGLYQVKEELTPVMNLMDSAQHLEDEDEQPLGDPPAEVAAIPADPPAILTFDLGLHPVEEGSGDVGGFTGEHHESVSDHEFVAALAGE